MTTPYPARLYTDTLPAWLGVAALWAGRRPVDTGAPFTVVDLGCGLGWTACWVKRLYPHAEVVGIDADPAQIAASRALAAAMGVDVRFVVGGFDAAPPCDVAVLHGVWSWIGDRQALVAALGRAVRDGGLVYVDYNALPGRAELWPLVRLVRRLAPTRDADGLRAALDVVERLEGRGALVGREGLAARWRASVDEEPGYLVHELLSEGWHADGVADVAAELAPAGLRYVGSTHLAEAVEPLLTTDAERAEAARAPDPVVAAAVRDVLRNTWYRRDLFQRGDHPLTDAERDAQLLDRWYALVVPPDAVTLTDAAGRAWPRPLPEAVLPVVAALADRPRRGADLAAALGLSAADAALRLGLLCGVGYVHPGDRRPFPAAVDDLMTGSPGALTVLSPIGVAFTLDAADQALWRDPDAPVDPGARAAFEAFRPAFRRAGW